MERLLAQLDDILPRDSRIMEVGCNDGRFLDRLREHGWTDLCGLEPTSNTSAEAIRRGFAVHHSPLDSRAASALVDDHGAWDCVVLRQVLEHVSDLRDFGGALNHLLRDDGLLVIEVPDSRNNIEGLDYALWEEHVNCFTAESLDRFLVRHGFQTVRSYTSVFSGVCLTVVARKTSRFGVGARSSNFGNILGLAPHIAYAVDDQPEKQSRFMPHSGIPIFPSDEMRSRDQRPALVLLGVNGESEETVLSKGSIPHGTRHASVLPPSPRLLEAWSLVRAR